MLVIYTKTQIAETFIHTFLDKLTLCGLNRNSADPDKTLHIAVSDLGLHSLLTGISMQKQ